MITDKEIWNYEKVYLARVIDEIESQIGYGMKVAANYKKEAIGLQKKMREEVSCAPTSLCDLEDAAQIWQYQVAISDQARKYKFSLDKLKRLQNMHKSPYFGRIDFIEDGEVKAEQIYIGIYNLSTSDMEIMVYDWRAPISSMFYDFEIGPSSYECPEGLINGQMTLKRQYKIENGNIIYMFDSSLSINDDMLREILGKSTDTKMKTIVTSIQREQNTVIRNDKDRILIVDGPAGSGKTSIALHRAAYILYRYRDSIKPENILIFSPNHVFEDYIANVLPELGEENIQRNTFVDFFANVLGREYEIETMNQQMEYILSGHCSETRLKSIKFKGSPGFVKALKKYVKHLEDGMNMEFKNIVNNGELIVSADEIWQLFKDDYSNFPYGKRLEKIRQRLFYILEQYEEKRVRELLEENIAENHAISKEEKLLTEQTVKTELDPIKNDIQQMTSFNIYLLYKNLFRNIESFVQPYDKVEIDDLRNISNYTISRLEQGIINYEDAAPIIYLKIGLDGADNAKSIKHVIIDEAQDYTVVQYEIFKKVFEHCNMTILGDVNQSVNGYTSLGSFDIISDILSGNTNTLSESTDQSNIKSISLMKSYRSSVEISDFCKEILKLPTQLEQLKRYCSKPKIIKVDKSNLYRRIADDIIRLKNRNYKLIAVICKTASQCNTLYKSIVPYVDINLISNQNEIYKGDVVVIPSYLAKGLEFDAVLVNSIEDEDYSKEEDRRLLYTVCTRALHELYLYYFDNMSCFIKNISKDFYSIDTVD